MDKPGLGMKLLVALSLGFITLMCVESCAGPKHTATAAKYHE